MKKFRIASLGLLLMVISILTAVSCGRTEETASCFPNVPVSVVLNLNLPAYYALQNTGGWIYVNEQSSGTRGLIVVRTPQGFKIYDRNAPHICPDANTTLEVRGNVKIMCPKDNAEWILITGEPAAVARTAPKNYAYSYDAASNTLSIFN